MSIFSPLSLTLLGTCFAMISTMIGACGVFFVKKPLNIKAEKMFIGFSAGIMISSSIWSLLIPSIEISQKYNINSLLSILLGFLLSVLCLKFLDKTLLSFHMKNKTSINPSLKKKSLMLLSITLHNIPEGIAIGVAFSLASFENSIGSFAGAIALSLAMALQNFPEGIAISLPFKKEGFSNAKCFFLGSLPGIVEPIGGIIGVFLASKIQIILPLILSFAAGTMIMVAVDELIPDCNSNQYKNFGTTGFMLGFALMVVLDIVLK